MNIIDLIKTYRGVLLGRPDYWHPQFKVSRHIDKDTPGRYYLDMSCKAEYPGKLDDKGIPLVVLDNRSYYFPVTIAQYALGNYDKYLAQKQEVCLQRFSNAASWFAENYTPLNSSCVWYTNFEKKLYSVKAPWVSALSQGQGLSVLTRAYLLCGRTRYLDIALKAAKLFEIPVSQGGIRALFKGKSVFYEEFPSEKPSLVLNGFIFSLWGLYDLYLVTENDSVLQLYQEGVRTLIAMLPEYDFFGWSRYDLYSFRIPNFCSIFYHRLHIEQLKVMHQLSGNQIFRRYQEDWSRGARSFPVIMLSQITKMIHKLSVRELCPSVDQ
jgi:heparosan-N-sulfate-glucuronate 5-epimerase